MSMTQTELEDLLQNTNSLIWGHWNEIPTSSDQETNEGATPVNYGQAIQLALRFLDPAATPEYIKFDESLEPKLGQDYYQRITALNADQQAAALAAFDAWAAVAQVSRDGAATDFTKTITLGFTKFQDDADGFTAVAPRAVDHRNHLVYGDVYINSEMRNSVATPGSRLFDVMLHEIGHALGIKHPVAQDGGDEPPYLSQRYRSTRYSALIYGSSSRGPFPSAPMLMDIAAIQRLYGANPTTRTGNDTYTFQTISGWNVQAIWDAGGDDTIDGSDQDRRLSIDLNPGGESTGKLGAISSRGEEIHIAFTPLTGNGQVDAAWANNFIENAIGGSHADRIVGNGGANRLEARDGNDEIFGERNADDPASDAVLSDDELIGGAGDDKLYGGGGVDTYVFNAGDGQDTIYDLDGEGAIKLNGITLAGGAFVAALHPEYKDKDVWRAEINGQEVFIVEWSGSIGSAAVLRIIGTAVGGDNHYIQIDDFQNGELGLSLPTQNGVTEIAGQLALSEGQAASLRALLGRPAREGERVVFTLDQHASAFQFVSGAQIIDFVNGQVELDLSEGQTEIEFALLSSGDIDSDLTLDLGAAFLDAQGNVIPTSSAHADVEFNYFVETSGTVADTIYVIDANSPNGGTATGAHSSIYGGLLGASHFVSWTIYEPEPPEAFQNEVIDMTLGAPEAGDNYLTVEAGLGDSYIIGSNYRDAITDGSNVAYYPEIVYGGRNGDNDVLIGGGGDDWLVTHGGNDRSEGGAGNDFIVDSPFSNNYAEYSDLSWVLEPGHNNSDVLRGDEGNDVIVAGGGNALIDGGADNDELYGGAHDDTLLGGAGNDVLSGDSRQTGKFGIYFPGMLTVGFRLPVYYNGQLWFVTGSLIEDTLAPGADFLDGGDGDDILIGGGNDDVLMGGEGADRLLGDTSFIPAGAQGLASDHGTTPLELQGDDRLYGEGGNDELRGGAGADSLDGGDGNDVLIGDEVTDAQYSGADYLFGGAGDDTLFGERNADQLVGGDGNDYLYGETPGTDEAAHGNDYLEGGAGEDVLVGGGGADTLLGGDDDDELHGDLNGTPDALQGNDYLEGGAGHDILVGGGGADTLIGGSGDDQLHGDSSAAGLHLGDRLEGGDGNDQLLGYGGDDVLDGGMGNDLLLGGAGNDVLNGGGGVDELQGGEGNDILIAGVDGGAMFGGAGDDTFIVSKNTSVVDTEGRNTIVASFLIINDVTLTTLATGTVVLNNAAGNYVSMSQATLSRLDSIELGGDGASLTEVLSLYQPVLHNPQLDPNYNVISLRPGIAASEVGYLAAGRDLVLTYAGPATDWVDVQTLRGRQALVTQRDGTAYGVSPGTQVLVLHNWYNTFGTQYLGILREYNGPGIDIAAIAGQLKHMYRGSAAGEDLLGEYTNDHLLGLGGDDFLEAREGDDIVEGGTGSDALRGGSGNDIYQYSAGDGSDFIVDGSGDDVVRFAPGIAVTDLSISETANGLVVRIGAVENGDVLTIADWSSGVGASLDGFVFDGGLSLNRSQIDALNTGNHSPRAAAPLGNQLVAEGELFSYTLPAGAFSDSEMADVLTYSATVVGGAPLPAWLAFDAATRTFSGTPPTGVAFSQLQVRVIASDGELGTFQDFYFIQPVLSTGTEGADNITGGVSVDRIEGLGGDDSLSGEGGDDLIFGGEDNDSLFGGTGDDRLEGWAGTDTYHAGDGDDVIVDTAGNDNIHADAGDDCIRAGIGNDSIRAGEGNDTIYYNRGDGADLLIGNTEAAGTMDVVRFGAGILPAHIRFDADWSRSAAGWSLRLTLLDAAGNRTSDALTFDDYFSSGIAGLSNRIEFVDDPLTVWTGYELELIVNTPTEWNNIIRGGAGADTIDGLGGHDNISGLLGNDTLYGGRGDDDISGGDGNDTLRGGVGDDHVHGDSGDDDLHGNSGRDTLLGGEGNDRLYAGGNAVTLAGGAGNDEHHMGAFSGTALGGRGDDVFLVERASTAVEQSIERDRYADGIMRATELDTLRFGGGILPSAITVAQKNDGSVYIDVAGSSGIGRTNRINIWDAEDDEPSVDLVTFDDAPSVTLTRAEIEHLSLQGDDAGNRLFGYLGVDIVRGNGGDDVLFGGSGNDDLAGGTGDDQLYGEAGDDTFRFGAGHGRDEVFDLNGSNRILLQAGITPASVTLYRTSGTGSLSSDGPATTAADSLVLVINGGADQLMIESFFDSSNPNSISELVFADGTAWNNAMIRAQVVDLSGIANSATGTAGNDVFTVDHRGDSVSDNSGGVDTVNSSITFTLPNNIENLTLAGPLAINGTGNSGANTITGNAAANVLNGAGGADTLIGGAGDDAYRVGLLGPAGTTVVELADGGYDTLYVAGNNSITLSNHVERLVVGNVGASVSYVGNELANVIDARDSYATVLTLDGGLGADILIGHQYADRFIIDNAGDVVIDRTAGDSDVVVTSSDYVIQSAGIEGVELTGSNAVTATGNEWANTLNGATNSAANVLIGGAGDDDYILGAGDTYVEAVDGGSDAVYVTAPAAAPGNVHDLTPYTNIEGLHATDGAGAATFMGDARSNRLTGNSFANILVGGAGDDRLAGGAGDDRYTGFGIGSGFDVIADTQGANVIEFSPDISLSDLTFERSSYEDLRIYVGSGGDGLLLTQAAASDTLAVRLTTGGLSYTYTTDQLLAVAAGQNSAPVKNIVIEGQSAMARAAWTWQLPANAFSDIESQSTLTYRVPPSALPDWLTFDPLTRTFSGTPQDVDIDNFLVTVTAVDEDGLSVDSEFLLEVVPWRLLGTLGDDVLVGDADDNLIDGLAGNDVISGLGGADILYGGSGDDTLDGGLGADELRGGEGNDIYVVNTPGDQIFDDGGIDEVRTTFSQTLAASLENLTLLGTSTLSGFGNSGDNVIIGNSAANTLWGNGGNDTLDGGEGNDSLSGHAGDDTYIVHTGDTVTESSGQGYDTIRASTAWTLATNFEALILTGTANINGTGNSVANAITGNAGNNTLIGNGGDDRLDGGAAGTDSLQGGQGNDTYVVARTTGITITEGSGAGTDTVEASVSYTLGSNVENLQLTGTGAINGNGNTLANTISGNTGNNTLTGGNGADIYVYSSGKGSDTINNSSTDTAQDRLNVTDLTFSQVTFSQSGNDLLMTRNGAPTDSVRVTGWFTTPGNRLDFVQFTDQTVTTAQISALFGSGLMAAPASSDGTVGGGAHAAAFDSAALQFIDALNHFGGKRTHRVVMDGGVKDYGSGRWLDEIAVNARPWHRANIVEQRVGRWA